MTKTENLTAREARIALAEGKCVEDRDGDIYAWPDSAAPSRWSRATNNWDNWAQRGNEIEPTCEPYRIVPDPSQPQPAQKTLTFKEAEEALTQRKYVKIQGQNLTVVTDKVSTENLTFLDLAERRGWPITLVEEEKSPAFKEAEAIAESTAWQANLMQGRVC